MYGIEDFRKDPLFVVEGLVVAGLGVGLVYLDLFASQSNPGDLGYLYLFVILLILLTVASIILTLVTGIRKLLDRPRGRNPSEGYNGIEFWVLLVLTTFLLYLGRGVWFDMLKY